MFICFLLVGFVRGCCFSSLFSVLICFEYCVALRLLVGVCFRFCCNLYCLLGRFVVGCDFVWRGFCFPVFTVCVIVVFKNVFVCVLLRLDCLLGCFVI